MAATVAVWNLGPFTVIALRKINIYFCLWLMHMLRWNFSSFRCAELAVRGAGSLFTSAPNWQVRSRPRRPKFQVARAEVFIYVYLLKNCFCYFRERSAFLIYLQKKRPEGRFPLDSAYPKSFPKRKDFPQPNSPPFREGLGVGF